MKKTIYSLIFVILFSSLSCTKDDLSLRNIATVKTAPFELVEIDGAAFDNGAFEAKIGQISTKVMVKNNTINWMVPNIEAGNYTMTIENREVDYELDVLIETDAAIASPKAYLLSIVNELSLGLTEEQILTMSAETQETYAQFIKSNYDQIVNSNSTDVSNKNSIQYREINVGKSVTFTVTAKEKWNGSNIYVNDGEVYEVTASGIWTDWFIDTDAEGYSKWYLSLAGFLKRAPKENWFKLIASVDRQQNYPIGASGEITTTESGNLEFFANDVMGFYWNNKGDVQVTVTRKM